MSLTIHTRRVRGCSPSNPDSRQVLEFAHYLAQCGYPIVVRRKHTVIPSEQGCFSQLAIRIG